MGLFSKLVKGLKKTIRGIGKAIKKVTKPIRKIVRKVLKPFGRIYGKLGWVGSLALMFALPAMAGWMGKWFQTFSQWATKPGVADWLTNASKALGNWSKTSRLRFDNITTKIKEGFNNVTGKVAGETGAEAITTAYPGGPGSIPIEAGAEQVVVKSAFQENILDPIKTVKTKVGQWFEDRPLFGQTKKYPAGHELAGQTMFYPDPLNVGKFTDVPIPKIASVQNVIDLGKAGLAGQQVYTKYFKDEPDYTAPFYNANIGLSNAMLGQTGTTSSYMDALQFADVGATEGDSYNTLARKYVSAWGEVVPPGTNPVKFAMDLPGYSYSLEDYYWDTIYGDQETSDLYDPYSNA